MRLALLALLLLAVPARAAFVAKADDFKCLKAGVAVPGKHFFVFHRNKHLLARAVAIATSDKPHRRYPVGTILQLFPFEAMVKRGGGFNPKGHGWEFFKLSVTAQGATIAGRGGASVLNFLNSSCQDCHEAAKRFDLVCEGHGIQSLGVSDQVIEALQKDPRCPQ